MNTHADKVQERKSHSAGQGVAPKQQRSDSVFRFVDHRPEAVTQRKLQEMADHKSGVAQLRSFQEMADNNTQTKQNVQLQAMSDSRFLQQPIQQKENDTGLEHEADVMGAKAFSAGEAKIIQGKAIDSGRSLLSNAPTVQRVVRVGEGEEIETMELTALVDEFMRRKGDRYERAEVEAALSNADGKSWASWENLAIWVAFGIQINHEERLPAMAAVEPEVAEVAGPEVLTEGELYGKVMEQFNSWDKVSFYPTGVSGRTADAQTDQNYVTTKENFVAVLKQVGSELRQSEPKYFCRSALSKGADFKATDLIVSADPNFSKGAPKMVFHIWGNYYN